MPPTRQRREGLNLDAVLERAHRAALSWREVPLTERAARAAATVRA